MSEFLPDDLRDLLALQLADGLGPTRIAALLEHFGTATVARKARALELARVPGIGEQTASKLAATLSSIDVDAELARMQQVGARLVALGRDGYPEALLHIPAPPWILFLRGEIGSADARSVAVVGTRHPDAAGKRITKRLAEGLAHAGVTVVSGLARGIDGIAHEAALDAGGRTLAVLGSGLGRIYPSEHKELASRVVGGGALVSEFPTDHAPAQWTFPARNRIISGLSRVIVIVQAPTDSGALITATAAAEQGRTVLAVPGPVDSEHHAGCHRLIRTGAVLCRSVEDILEELDGVSTMATRERERKTSAPHPPALPLPAGPPPGLDTIQARVWELLAEGPRGGDEIARLAEVAVPQLATILLTLEMRKVIRRLPGNRYERT